MSHTDEGQNIILIKLTGRHGHVDTHFSQTYTLVTGIVENHRLPSRTIEAHVRRSDPLSAKHRPINRKGEMG